MDAEKPGLICQEAEMKKIRARVLCGLLIFGVPFLLLSACGGSGGGGGSSAGTGTVSVSLTDNQNSYNAVVLTIVEVGIVASNTASTYYNSSELDNLPLTVNVLDFPDEETLHLADIEVELPENGDPVCFKQIRLVLAAEGDPDCPGSPCNYVVETGDPAKYELKTPSGQQSGVKILTPNDFCIDVDNDAVQVSIDFDPATAIVHNENNSNSKSKDKYILKPTGIRIITGNWFTAPDSFIDGLVAVPTYNSATGCEELATTPLVTIAAYYNSATMTGPPVVQTVALADAPSASAADICAEWCSEESDVGACVLSCEEGLLSEYYCSGNFKLLLQEKETYDLAATWQGFSDEVLNVEYNSTVLFELIEE
jgi:hypothetical protein